MDTCWHHVWTYLSAEHHEHPSIPAIHKLSWCWPVTRVWTHTQWRKTQLCLSTAGTISIVPSGSACDCLHQMKEPAADLPHTRWRVDWHLSNRLNSKNGVGVRGLGPFSEVFQQGWGLEHLASSWKQCSQWSWRSDPRRFELYETISCPVVLKHESGPWHVVWLVVSSPCKNTLFIIPDEKLNQ